MRALTSLMRPPFLLVGTGRAYHGRAERGGEVEVLSTAFFASDDVGAKVAEGQDDGSDGLYIGTFFIVGRIELRGDGQPVAAVEDDLRGR